MREGGTDRQTLLKSIAVYTHGLAHLEISQEQLWVYMWWGRAGAEMFTYSQLYRIYIFPVTLRRRFTVLKSCRQVQRPRLELKHCIEGNPKQSQ